MWVVEDSEKKVRKTIRVNFARSSSSGDTAGFLVVGELCAWRMVFLPVVLTIVYSRR